MDTLGPEIFKNPHPDKTWKARCTRWSLRLGGAAILIAVGVAGSTWLSDSSRPAAAWTVGEMKEALVHEDDQSAVNEALGVAALRSLEIQQALADYASKNDGRLNAHIAKKALEALRNSADDLLKSLDEDDAPSKK